MTSQSHFYGKLNSFPVHFWQRTRVRKRDRAYMDVGRAPDGRKALTVRQREVLQLLAEGKTMV